MSIIFLLTLFLAAAGWAVNLLLAFKFFYNLHSSKKILSFYPPVTILMPCRGLDQNYKENFYSFLSQEYPEYEVIFIVDSLKDPVFKFLSSLKINNPPSKIKIVIQKSGDRHSGKVSAQLSGIKHVKKESKVLVFADSDFVAAPDWLEKLVSPLSLESIKVSTGMMWYTSNTGIWSLVRALTRNLGDGLLHGIWPFIWAGSCAIDKETFFKEKLPQVWRRAIFDDTSMSQHLRHLGYKIYFSPLAEVAQRENCSLSQYINQMTRSFAVNKIEDGKTWLLALFLGSITTFPWVLGLILLSLTFIYQRYISISATLLLTVLISRILGGLIIYRLRKERPFFIYLLPLADLVCAFCFVKSISLRSFILRGRKYRLS